MSITQDVRTYLLTQSTVTALVGTRIYYDHLPQRATLPALVVNLITSVSQREVDAASGTARARVQVDCYAATYAASASLGELVRKVTEQYTGTMGSTTVDRAHVETVTELDDGPTDGSDAYRYIRSLDVVLWHNEALPIT